jgi:uncharacterized protein (TIGR03085 family)
VVAKTLPHTHDRLASRGTVPLMSLAKEERQGICDTLLELGPDQPTLCVGWTTRDMLAHLVLRERRPDAAVGILVRPFSGHTTNVMAQVAEQPFHELVATFRSGPPWWSVFAIPGVGDRANMFELYVHHEDIRRAQPDWHPRAPDAHREDTLWGGLTNPMGRMLFRRCSVGVVLRAAGRPDVVVKKGEPAVHVVGEPSEITLVAFGRPTDHTRVVVQGAPDDIAKFESSPRGI